MEKSLQETTNFLKILVSLFSYLENPTSFEGGYFIIEEFYLIKLLDK